MKNLDHYQKISPFVADITRILPKCTDSVNFEKFIFTQRDFKLIMNNCLNCEYLRFESLKLNFTHINFSFKSKSKIKTIHFENFGKKDS